MLEMLKRKIMIFKVTSLQKNQLKQEDVIGDKYPDILLYEMCRLFIKQHGFCCELAYKS